MAAPPTYRPVKQTARIRFEASIVEQHALVDRARIQTYRRKATSAPIGLMCYNSLDRVAAAPLYVHVAILPQHERDPRFYGCLVSSNEYYDVGLELI